MKQKKTKKPSRIAFLLLRLALLVFTIYVVVMLVYTQSRLSEVRKLKESLENEIRLQSIQNEDIQDKLNDPERHQEQSARDKDYVYPGEDVYIEAPGS